ncbi:MAG: hypothetical protein LUD72_04340, partial [Bacteroidales bacterium]|nr:hypothetical protein [Bacteroidales bacterium]
MDEIKKTEVTKEQIDAFLAGHDPMEHIIKVECSYSSPRVCIVYRADDGKLKVIKEDFHPFVWTTRENSRKLFNGDRELLKHKMTDYGIGCKGLRVHDTEGNIHPRMANGYRVLFFARMPMSYAKFLRFFDEAGIPVYDDYNDETP